MFGSPVSSEAILLSTSLLTLVSVYSPGVNEDAQLYVAQVTGVRENNRVRTRTPLVCGR